MEELSSSGEVFKTPSESTPAGLSSKELKPDGGGNGGADNNDPPSPPPPPESVRPLGQAMHPLEVPVIVSEVLNYLKKIPDLRSIRLLSKLWRNESLDKWRKTAVFSLASYEAQQTLKLTLGINEGDAAAVVHGVSPTSTIYNFHDKPFRQYRLEKGEIFPPDLPAIQNQLYFWENCGPSITYLDLGECFFKMGLYFYGLSWILSSCPNLEELKFAPYKYAVGGDDDFRFEDAFNWIFERGNLNLEVEGRQRALAAGDRLESLTIYSSRNGEEGSADQRELFSENVKLLIDFFSLIPNLNIISLTNLNSFEDITEALHKQAFTNSLAGQPFVRLKKFLADDFNDELHFFSNYLTNHSPELNVLKIRSWPFQGLLEEPSQLWETLKGIKGHVKELDLSFHCDDYFFDSDDEQLKPDPSFDLFNLRFPQLTKLNLVFDYKSWKGSISQFLSFDFGLLRGTPNLKYLHFGARNDCTNDLSVKEKLKVKDLVKEKEQSWHWEIENEDEIKIEEEEPFLPDEEIILDKMEEFYFEGVFSAEALRFLGKVMKNLKVLGTILDDETFPVVFETWGVEKLRKVTLLMLHAEQVGCHLIAKQMEITPEVEIVKLVEKSRGHGWTSREDLD